MTAYKVGWRGDWSHSMHEPLFVDAESPEKAVQVYEGIVPTSCKTGDYLVKELGFMKPEVRVARLHTDGLYHYVIIPKCA